MSSPSGDQRGESCEQANQPVLCANGCGFFGNPASLNLCSKCYRGYCAEQERRKTGGELISGAANSLKDLAAATSPQAEPATAVATTTAAASTDAGTTRPVSETAAAGLEPAVVADTAAAAAPAAATADEGGQPVQKNTSRCFSCNKRVGLTGFKCRCGYVFCGTHRYAEKHDCSFDYKSAGRQTLAKNNPLVAAAKVEKL